MESGFVLQAKGLSKAFPGVQALKDVSLDVAPGQVHALMGENGAGKSTLMKILTAVHAPDAGQICFEGRAVQLRSPHQALRMGISMIHQELMPFPDMTVAENISMGREPARFGWLNKTIMHREASGLLKRLGVDLPSSRKMRDLGVAEMQTVEIAKALARNARVLIMDEPTSAISEREVESLFAVIRDLKQRGVAIIYVSHKMGEIFRIADMVTVLRDGAKIATHPIGELDENTLIRLMVGRELRAAAPGAARGYGDTVLEVRGLSRPGKFRDAGFTVRRGEILGIAGLMGAGRTELVSAIYGLAPAAAGEIRVNGRKVRIASPADAIAAGIGMAGEDRKLEGLVPGMTVKHNLTLASLPQYCRGGIIDHRAENRVADQQIARFGIRTPGRNQAAGRLSGGNQQKIVVAKVLLADPSVLILDEPTRGIDVGAKAEIYGIVRTLAAQGKAVIVVSSELEEILALSDRILVMREGAISAELDAACATQEEIMKYAMPQ